MEIEEIKEAIDLKKQLYYYNNPIEIVFFEELTETIQIRFVESGITTYAVKSVISAIQKEKLKIKINYK